MPLAKPGPAAASGHRPPSGTVSCRLWYGAGWLTSRDNAVRVLAQLDNYSGHLNMEAGSFLMMQRMQTLVTKELLGFAYNHLSYYDRFVDSKDRAVQRERAAALRHVAEAESRRQLDVLPRSLIIMPLRLSSGKGVPGQASSGLKQLYLNATYFSVARAFETVVAVVQTDEDYRAASALNIHRDHRKLRVVLASKRGKQKVAASHSTLQTLYDLLSSTEGARLDAVGYTEADQLVYASKRFHWLSERVGKGTLFAPHRLFGSPRLRLAKPLNARDEDAAAREPSTAECLLDDCGLQTKSLTPAPPMVADPTLSPAYPGYPIVVAQCHAFRLATKNGSLAACMPCKAKAALGAAQEQIFEARSSTT